MASTKLFGLFAFFLLLLSAAVAEDDHRFPLGEEKRTHLRFYLHDILGGPEPTTLVVATAKTTSKSPTLFGTVVMADDPLTEGPEPTSKLVGRAQGLYASASKREVALLMAMNFAFVGGEYNGSSLAILGRNGVFSGVGEMPVVGGSGRFRLAQGYALARTHRSDATSGDATVEYNVYVVHH
ncbi:hypothetical protein Taro_035830 [Colocasia esculenta]|uniref:Dirigent protein n=1 Tax=Colocasia esculenta TaxID=4460 RepID=A0A843VVL6_COLES|nr:hypothetical protein [Colocasia esculenta]